MVMSGDQNAGHFHSVRIDNITFKRVIFNATIKNSYGQRNTKHAQQETTW